MQEQEWPIQKAATGRIETNAHPSGSKHNTHVTQHVKKPDKHLISNDFITPQSQFCVTIFYLNYFNKLSSFGPEWPS